MHARFRRTLVRLQRRPPVLALLAVALVLAALHAHAAAPAEVDVSIARFAFGPSEITVAPGTKVVWTNRDEAPHTVATQDKSVASKGLDTGDRFEHTFTAEGDFTYLCTVHPFMSGVVHVRRP